MSIQIPNLHTSNKTGVNFEAAKVFINRLKDASHTGEFILRGSFSFNPATDAYPSGNLTIEVNLKDSVKDTVFIKTVEQLDTTGRDTPIAFATGRCTVGKIPTKLTLSGCRYWLMMADNKSIKEEQTPDVISFLVYDRNGKRVAYGTGPVVKGDVTIVTNGE
jgi:hypothetical protein